MLNQFLVTIGMLVAIFAPFIIAMLGMSGRELPYELRKKEEPY